jgi:hypothetical protein
MMPDYNDAYDIFYYKVFESLRQTLCYGFYVDDKLIGVTVNYPLEEYLQMSGKPTTSKLFELLGKYGREVVKVIPCYYDRKG